MSGRLTGIGVGPGDPELLTLKGLSRLRGADVVAYPVLGGHESFTRRVVSDYLGEGQRELPLEIPLIVSDAEQPLALVSEDSLTSHDVGSSERCPQMPAGAARKKIKRVKRDDNEGVVPRGVVDNDGDDNEGVVSRGIVDIDGDNEGVAVERSSALVSEDSLTSHDVGSSERRQLMPAGAARKKIKRVKRDDKGGVVSRGIGDNEGVARDEVELAYDRAADLLRAELRAGNNVVVLCEGDPFFYGSFGYLYERLSGEREVEVIPGVSSLTATAATAGRVLALGGESFCVLSGVAPIDFLRARLSAGENFAIIKPSRCWRELLAVLDDLGLLPRARLVVRSGLPDEMVYDLEHSRPASVPYFSVVLIR
ncbi:MAG: precorrin-2 C(20)-methyltransferase [Alphaproteobacteria bacterium]|nr:precorrin-2 C(20)-methyltransferase [Alphaproteobacteria bacterium]MDA8013055.1 precorrin-2 C(20)-methyltransferase [Alphaproteobacteria bacterium]